MFIDMSRDEDGVAHRVVGRTSHRQSITWCGKKIQAVELKFVWQGKTDDGHTLRARERAFGPDPKMCPVCRGST